MTFKEDVAWDTRPNCQNGSSVMIGHSSTMIGHSLAAMGHCFKGISNCWQRSGKKSFLPACAPSADALTPHFMFWLCMLILLMTLSPHSISRFSCHLDTFLLSWIGNKGFSGMGDTWQCVENACMVCQWLWTFVKETAMCTRSGSCILMFLAIHNVRSSNQCPLLHSLKSVRTQLQTRLAHSCVKIENVTVVVHLCNGACQFWNDCSMSSIFVPEVALGCEPVQIFILTTVAIQKFLAMTIGSLCQFHFLLGCLAWWVKDESFIHSHKWLGLEFMSVPSRKWRHSNVLALTRFRSCTQIGADTDGFKEKRRKKELKGEFMDIFICVHSMQV